MMIGVKHFNIRYSLFLVRYFSCSLFDIPCSLFDIFLRSDNNRTIAGHIMAFLHSGRLMAKITDNNATHGIRGKVNQLVYSQRYGETVVSKPPIRTAPYSESQRNIVSIFKQAVLYARAILQNALIKQAYKAKAKRGQSAYNLAVADYFKPPVIVSVDLGQFANQIGSKITALVTDNFRVESVKVKIEKPGGFLLEEGTAVLQPDGLNWQYTTTTADGNTAGNTVSIIATDLPGHSTVEQKTI